jgi:hypothetical protein
MIFGTYTFLKNLRNNFLFSNVLALYDHVLSRNAEITSNKQVMLRAYLSGHLEFIDSNIKHIREIYQTYIEQAVKSEYQAVELPDVSKIAAFRRDQRDPVGNIMANQEPASSGLRPMGTSSMVKQRSRGRSISKSDMKKKADETNFDLKIVQLNTEYHNMPSNELRHEFSNMLKEYETVTDNFQKVKVRVILIMACQALLSNWHYVCYFLMILYTFLNGGINGFIYVGAIIIFVLVEEDLPSIIFWKMCFFNTATAFWMKLLLDVFVQQLVSASQTTGDTKTYIDRISRFFFGKTAYTFEIFIMIFILIELILIDEMGFKKKKMIDFEDMNESYIRMKINKIFALREREKFKSYVSYLKALYDGMQLGATEGSNVNKRTKKGLKLKQSPPLKLRSGSQILEGEKDEINIDEVIEYEQNRSNAKTEVLKETIKDIEKNIFINSFGRVTEENKKSFLWQLFTVYVILSKIEQEAWNRFKSTFEPLTYGYLDLHHFLYRSHVRRNTGLL